MKNPIHFLSSMLLLASFPMYAQHYNTEVEASIDLQVQDASNLRITGLALNKTEIEKSLRYVLSVIKSDKNSGNRSTND